MRATALGEVVTHLPWLSPGLDALVALTRTSLAATWMEVRADPGAVLLIVRRATATSTASALTASLRSFNPAILYDPAILDGALSHLQDYAGVGFVDWNQPTLRPIYQSSIRTAKIAYWLAERANRCDPEYAWIAGLLAPLGWLAMAAVDPAAVLACWTDPEFAHHPAATQRRHWGLDQAGIARRLARHWQLPRWLSATAGYLGLPAEVAQALGAEPDLFRVVQLSVGLLQRQEAGLHLEVGATPGEAAAALNLTLEDLERLDREIQSLREQPADPKLWHSPTNQPLLHDLLRVTIDNRRLRDAPTLQRLENDLDNLQRALQDERMGAVEQLRAQKLNALAEFAAGAGHEINNPLAVISGQAQYLLNHEQEPSRQQSLQTIIGQTRRIHLILRELMQFARPPQPQKQLLDLSGLVREVSASLSELAAQRRVRLVCPEPESPIQLPADPDQVRTALTCLLRNAIEAAPEDGWAGIHLETPSADQVEVIIEDNGSGPPPPQREHLFDPFYSGRSAGRGRGLGLPTAWRLARQHGGDVRFINLPNGPTRFVLSLAREMIGNGHSQ